MILVAPYSSAEEARSKLAQERHITDHNYEWNDFLPEGEDLRVAGWKRDGLPEGVWVIEAGDARWSLVEYKSGEPNGVAIYLTPDGIVISTGLFVEGKEDGVWKYFDDTGTVTRHLTYQAGFETGLCQDLAEDGNVKLEGMLLDGVWDGAVREYSEGHLIGEGAMDVVDGLSVRSGKWTLYDVESNVVAEGELRGSTRIGEWKVYKAGCLVAVHNFGINGEVNRSELPLFDILVKLKQEVADPRTGVTNLDLFGGPRIEK